MKKIYTTIATVVFACSTAVNVTANANVSANVNEAESESGNKSRFIQAGSGDTYRPLPGHGELSVQFTGAGGVYIATQDIALMADPFFSNPGMSDLLLLKQLKPNDAVIDRWLPSTVNVAGIIVGHGHYDHLLDVPTILNRLPASAKVYASKTSNHMIASSVEERRRVDLNASMASATQRGEWVEVNPRLRILPILSEHSPHLLGTVFASSILEKDNAHLPSDALDWQSGTTLSYVIDILAEDKASVHYRVFYQSSSSGYPLGAPPQWLANDGVPVDLAILCMANFDSVDNYPQGILNQLKPKHVFLTHWETFWDTYIPNEASVLPGLDIEVFLAQVKQVVAKNTPVYLPQRGAFVTLTK